MPFSNRSIGKTIKNKPTIFVSIASYRDERCKNTVVDLFNKAEYPFRVYVGILTQNNKDYRKESCIPNSKYSYQNNIRLRNISYQDASGPLKARALICKYFYRSEDYFLMIDAHSKFANNWDSELIRQLEFLKDNGIVKPILTNYTSDIKIRDSGSQQVPLICGVVQDTPIPLSMRCDAVTKNKFAPGYFIGAGFMFSNGSFIKDIGFAKLDAFQHVFNGEEILYAILAYSHGYNIYTPADNLVFHEYGNRGPSYFADRGKTTSDLDKIVACLKEEIKPPYFKLGKKRSITSYWDAIGFKINETDPTKKWDLDKKKSLCKPLEKDIIIYQKYQK